MISGEQGKMFIRFLNSAIKRKSNASVQLTKNCITLKTVPKCLHSEQSLDVLSQLLHTNVLCYSPDPLNIWDSEGAVVCFQENVSIS